MSNQIEIEEDKIISLALSILEKRMNKAEILFNSPDIPKRFLVVRLSQLPHEVFGAIFLNYKGEFICYKELFRGSVDHTAVSPREVVKEALKVNASYAILAHNHPSGDETSSEADDELTKMLIKTLALVDIQVVDHIIVGGVKTYSYCEKGKLM